MENLQVQRMAKPQQPHRIQLAGPWEVEWWTGQKLATRQRWRGRPSEVWPVPPESLTEAITECRWIRRFNRPATWLADWRVEIALQFLAASSTVHLNGHVLHPAFGDSIAPSTNPPFAADFEGVEGWRSGDIGKQLVVGANELRLTYLGSHSSATWWRGARLEVWEEPTLTSEPN
jgi:hypothetical protein